MKSNMVNRFKSLNGQIEWYTPRQYLDLAIATMGEIDLDPASSTTAQKHVKAKKFFTARQNGLKQKWFGRVFLNPPYAMPYIKEFSSKLIKSIVSGDVSQAIMLTNNATDTEWFHALMGHCNAICFTRGRISFLNGKPKGYFFERICPMTGQAFFYFGSNAKEFSKVFASVGRVIEVHNGRKEWDEMWTRPFDRPELVWNYN